MRDCRGLWVPHERLGGHSRSQTNLGLTWLILHEIKNEVKGQQLCDFQTLLYWRCTMGCCGCCQNRLVVMLILSPLSHHEAMQGLSSKETFTCEEKESDLIRTEVKKYSSSLSKREDNVNTKRTQFVFSWSSFFFFSLLYMLYIITTYTVCTVEYIFVSQWVATVLSSVSMYPPTPLIHSGSDCMFV